MGATFLIDEGRARRVWWKNFVGNTIASSARMRTQIDTKPPILWIFKGDMNQKRIDEDVQKLTAYYRGHGSFLTTIGAEYLSDDVTEEAMPASVGGAGHAVGLGSCCRRVLIVAGKRTGKAPGEP